jgi:hypothetical protein
MPGKEKGGVMAGIMVVAAFAVALAVLVGGFVHSRWFSRGGMFLEGLGEFMYAAIPGAAGLALAAVAAAVWWLAPAWAWLPAALSACASVSMLALLAFSNAVDCWSRRRSRRPRPPSHG